MESGKEAVQVIGLQCRQFAAASEAGVPGGLMFGENFGLDGLHRQGTRLQLVALAPAEHFLGGCDQLDDFREQGIIGVGEDFFRDPRTFRIERAMAFAK